MDRKCGKTSSEFVDHVFTTQPLLVRYHRLHCGQPEHNKDTDRPTVQLALPQLTLCQCDVVSAGTDICSHCND